MEEEKKPKKGGKFLRLSFYLIFLVIVPFVFLLLSAFEKVSWLITGIIIGSVYFILFVYLMIYFLKRKKLTKVLEGKVVDPKSLLKTEQLIPLMESSLIEEVFDKSEQIINPSIELVGETRTPIFSAKVFLHEEERWILFLQKVDDLNLKRIISFRNAEEMDRKENREIIEEVKKSLAISPPRVKKDISETYDSTGSLTGRRISEEPIGDIKEALKKKAVKELKEV